MRLCGCGIRGDQLIQVRARNSRYDDYSIGIRSLERHLNVPPSDYKWRGVDLSYSPLRITESPALALLGTHFYYVDFSTACSVSQWYLLAILPECLCL
jgi:hypothetical protein